MVFDEEQKSQKPHLCCPAVSVGQVAQSVH